MPRLFVNKDQLPVISGSDVHYIKDVLRLKAGDRLELLDGTGQVYLSKIAEIKKDQVVCEIMERRTQNTELGTRVTIAQCLPRARKMDVIIQKCTELGAAGIIPTLSERSIARGEKSERWQKIAKEAAEQSGRSTIPQIEPLTKFTDVLKQAKDYDLALIPWELERTTILKSLLTTALPHYCTTILILIGPEGGFSHSEVERAKESGFKPVTIGKTILRTETAGPAILAMINYALDG